MAGEKEKILVITTHLLLYGALAQLSDASFDDLLFFGNVFYQKQCKYATNQDC